MASAVPPGAPLDGPPPSPAAGGPGAPQGPPIMSQPPDAGAMAGGQTSLPDPIKGALQMAADVDRAILVLAQQFPQGAKEFRAAKQLIQAGLAKALKDLPSVPSSSPTSSGLQFPGTMMMGGGSFGQP